MEGKEQFFPNFAPYPVPQSHTVTADIQHPSIEQLKKELWGHCDPESSKSSRAYLKLRRSGSIHAIAVSVIVLYPPQNCLRN